jgi:glutathione synthase/RimK-type ligase-like ATP-grasp enzyme
MQVSILCPTPDCALDWQPAYARLAEVLELAGFQTQALPWTELGDVQTGFVAACLAWGYHLQPSAWIGMLRPLLDAVGIANPARSLIWNSDKIYLKQLGQAVPVVPTHFAARLDEATASTLRDRFRTETLVAKPRWGAGAHGLTFLHEGALVPPLRDVLVQPMLRTIPTEGEVSLIYFDGRFNHAVRKLPASGDWRVQSEFGGSVEPFRPSEDLVELGAQAIRLAPDVLTYARVDVVKGNDGQWQLIELEAIEPELFLGFAPEDGRALGEAFRRKFAAA